MRVVVQRTSKASITVNSNVVGAIDHGLVVLLGIETADDSSDVEWLCNKLLKLRVFEDDDQNMNRSIIDVDGQFLVVSQFTLHASTKKGTRPSFIKAARPEQAEPLYEAFCSKLQELNGKPIEKGVFGAMMDVKLVNDGPVTIIIDSKNRE